MSDQQKKIVVIESDARVVEMTRDPLEEIGHIVLVAADALNGLALVRRELPDLVLVDAHQSNLRGIELCGRIRKDPATSEAKILVIADESDVGNLAVGAFSDLDDYIVKPFDKAELLTKITPLLAKKQDPHSMQVSTGNSDLDNKIGGGVPVGSLTLIEGDSGAGKSVLAQQMIHGCLKDGNKLSLFTSENSIKSLIRQMQSLNFDVLDYVLLDQLRVFPMETSRLGKEAPGVLMQAMKREKGRDMLFVDSLTSSIPSASENQVLSFFEESKRLCSDRRTVLVIIHSHALTRELLTRIRSLCDAHLQLKTEEVGSKLVKTLEVTKVRGADQSTGNIVSFEVEPGWGIRVIPINKVKG